MLSQSYANNSFNQCNCARTDGLSCKRSDDTSDHNIEEYLNLLTSKFEKLGMPLPIILTCLLGMCLLYFAVECCSSDLISMDVFLLGPGPKMENDSKTSKGVLFLKIYNVATLGVKALLNLFKNNRILPPIFLQLQFFFENFCYHYLLQ